MFAFPTFVITCYAQCTHHQSCGNDDTLIRVTYLPYALNIVDHWSPYYISTLVLMASKLAVLSGYNA